MATKNPTVVRINGKVECKILQGRGGNWIAVCDSLQLTIQANTWANLMEDIGFTLDVILRDLLSSNELERFIKERGWTLVGRIPRRHTDVCFDLPFFPAMMKPHDSQRDLRQ